MADRLNVQQRFYFAAAGLGAFCLAALLALGGFALTAVWPGLSWAIGSALGLITALLGFRWIWAAVVGYAPRPFRSAAEHRGTI